MRNKISAALLIYKLAIVRALLYSTTTAGTTFLAAVQNVDFPSMTHWNQFCLLLGVFITWAGTMIAFLDKTSSRIASGQSVFETGQTEFLTRPNAGSGTQSTNPTK